MAREYGSLMGVEEPGRSRAKRLQAKEATPVERRAAIKALERRQAGEARRSHESGRGSSQGTSLSVFDAAQTIKNKKASDRKLIDEAG